MNRAVADAAQRLRALQPEISCIIQAPAGSGKTELLIQRYLLLLARVEHPEEIISITFTRKAAAEMQSRIIRALQRGLDAQAPDSAHELQTWELARAALRQAGQQGWNLLQQPSRLRVQTIDSLCASLTRQMPVLSRLGAQPEVVEDASSLYLQAARRTLGELEQDSDTFVAIESLLRHLDNDLPKVEAMLVTMLATRDQWLRHTLNASGREELETALRNAIDNSLQQLLELFAPALGIELCELAATAAQNLQETEKVSSIVKCLGISTLPAASAEDIEQWQGLAELCLTQKGEWRKTVNVNTGFPPSSSVAGYEAKQMKARFADCMAGLADDEDLRIALAAVRDLPPAVYSESQWQVIESLFVLLLRSVAHLTLLFAETGKTDFAGVASGALQALGSQDEVTDLALALDYRVQHLLVDEFQDTSVTQYLLLERLTAGWQSGDGRSLMLVGDPMQSIYRFREAEVGLFLRVRKARLLGNVVLEPLQLSVNFRSEAGIVDWVNQQFSRAFPEHENIANGAVCYAPSSAMHDNSLPASVSLHPCFGGPQDEAGRVLEIIQQTRLRDSEASIAILVRGRSHLLEISQLLSQQGLKYRAVDIEPLVGRLAIRDVMALTRALNHPADRIAWLALLRAPWCGLELADLLTLVADSDATLLSLMYDDDRLGRLSGTGQQRLQHCRQVLMEAVSQRQRRSLRRWVETTWLLLGGPACVEDESDLLNVETFFSLLEAHDQGGMVIDMDELEQAVAKLYAAPQADADERLQLMTMHKAKGLEFDTVILPGLAKRSRQDDPRLLFWLERPVDDESNELLLAPVKAVGSDSDPHYRYLRQLDADKGQLEVTRLLYVAATRAVKSLHLLATVGFREEEQARELKAPAKGSLLARIWPMVEADFEQALTAWEVAPEATERARSEQRLQRLASDWQMPDLPADLPWSTQQADDLQQEELEFSWASQTIRHVGIIVHAWLQQFSQNELTDWDQQRVTENLPRFRQQLQAEGVPEEELQMATELVQTALNNCLEDPQARWILSRGHSEARSEYALTGFHRQKRVNVILDRTFVDEEGNRWVIDYKTSRHQGQDLQGFLDNERERYRQQLERYAEIIRQMDDRPIRLGLYFPLYRGWREWTPGEEPA